MSVFFNKSNKNGHFRPKTTGYFENNILSEEKLYLETIISCRIFTGPK